MPPGIHQTDSLLGQYVYYTQSQDLVGCHAATAVNLFESFDFMVNYQKSILLLTKQMDFQGLMLDLQILALALP